MQIICTRLLLCIKRSGSAQHNRWLSHFFFLKILSWVFRLNSILSPTGARCKAFTPQLDVRAGRRQHCHTTNFISKHVSYLLIPTPWCHRQVLIGWAGSPRRLFFPSKLGLLCCGGRVGKGDTGKCRCLFPFCHVCESDYRSLSQYLASADGIIDCKFIFSGPSHICCLCHAR